MQAMLFGVFPILLEYLSLMYHDTVELELQALSSPGLAH